MKTVAELLAAASAQLDSPTARLDCELLLCHVLDWSRSRLRAYADAPLGESQLDQFNSLLQRRQQGEPVAHLLGSQGFWSLDLEVNNTTLIPRPDTELVVETALALVNPSQPARVADLGTGTGAIALALAAECPRWQLVATDRIEAAVALAKRNAIRNQLNNVEVRLGSWCEPLDEHDFSMIVSNPPYIRADDPHLEQGDVRFEPLSALVAGEDGLDDIRHLSKAVQQHLQSGGWLLLEHGFDQGAEVRDILQQDGYLQVETRQDLAGHDRVTLGCKP